MRTARRPIAVIQHVEVEGPGLLAREASKAGHALELVRTWAGDAVPKTSAGYAGVVVMGGPMGAYELQRHPNLIDEIRLLESCLSNEVPVIGVCLGSQLLAAAAGGRVYPTGSFFLGWSTLRPSSAARADPVWNPLPDEFDVLKWHGDYFDLPPDAIILGSSRSHAAEAFRIGPVAYGALFHFEVSARMLRAWVAFFEPQLRKAGLIGDAARAVRHTEARTAASGRAWSGLASGWLTSLRI